MEMQFVPSCFKVNITERLKSLYGKLGKPDKDAAIACESLEVNVAFAIEVRAHLFDLEIGHVTKAPA